MKWAKKNIILISGTLMTVASMALYAFKEYNRRLPDLHSIRPSLTLKESELIHDFEIDEAKATEKYAGKVINVKGKINNIEITDSSATIFLNDGSTMAAVMCQFDKKNIEEIHEMKKKETTIIKGVVTGFLMDVILVRCVIEQ